VTIKNTLHPNTYKLTQSCDWFAALLESAVKSVKFKLNQIKYGTKTQQLSSLPNALATGLILQNLKVKWQSHILAHRQV